MYAAWVLARSVASSRHISSDDKCIARVALTLILLLVPLHLINPYFINTGVAHPLWILFGMVAAAAEQFNSWPAPRGSGDPLDADPSQAHSRPPRPAVT